jgi:hypothetical protein
MKANELRIGNCLMKIDGTLIEVSSLEIECAEGMSGHFNLTFNPIPLTEEWLFNLGFDNKFNKGKINIIPKGRLGYENGRTYFNSWVILEKQPDYVHELQNLYYALTQKELKLINNIKVLIEDSDMSVRLINRLKNKVSFSCNKQVLVITYLDEISNYTKKEVYEIYDLRAKEMKELQEVMLRFNIEFKEE